MSAFDESYRKRWSQRELHGRDYAEAKWHWTEGRKDLAQRYLALADECKQKAEAMVKDRAYELGSDVTLEWIEKRLRAIAEGREER